MTLDQALNFAQDLHRSNQLDRAENLCRQILSAIPDQPLALYILADISRQKGMLTQSLELTRRSLALRPNETAPLFNLALTLRALGQIDQAIDIYRQLIARNPSNIAEIYCSLGNAHKAQNQIAQAVEAYKKATTLNPQYALAFYNLGIALLDLALIHEAVEAYQKALAIAPDFALAHINLGNLFMALGQNDQAINCFQNALALNPQLPLSYINLANAFNALGQFEKALNFCSQALGLHSNDPEIIATLHNNIGNIYNNQGSLDLAIEHFIKSIQFNPHFPAYHSNLILGLHYSIHHTEADIHRELQLYNARFPQPQRPAVVDPNPQRKLRVGFVSPDFRDHPISRFIPPLFENLDPDQFEIFAYSDLLNPDPITHAIRAKTHQWRDSFSLTNDQLADQIKRDQIDILFDLAAHAGGNRLPVFALKPAPIQITWLAYCGSTGLSAIDYRISDPYMDPPGLFDNFYSEKTLRLPDCYWCYSAPANSPDPRFPETPNPVFGCFNTFHKINEAVLALWARILNQLPQSSLLLFSREGSHRNQTLEFFQSHGVVPSRIRFFSKLPPADYYALYNQVHVALDPFPFNGGTTTCDALYMGVPVVSLVSTDRAVGRAGLSLLSQVHLTDLAVDSPDQYVETAVALAQDTSRLQMLRDTLRLTMQSSPLMDAPRFGKNFGDLLRQVWTHP